MTESIFPLCGDHAKGVHACAIWDTEKDFWVVSSRFLLDGLLNNEKVMFFSERSLDDFLHYFEDIGVDLSKFIEKKQLFFLTAEEAYLQNGTFDYKTVVQRLKNHTDLAIKEGWKRLRLQGELGFCCKMNITEQIFEYERSLGDFFYEYPCIALCQYSSRVFSSSHLLNVLMTHPRAVINCELFDNFYYMNPKDLLVEDRSQAIFSNWRKNLKDKKVMEKKLIERTEELERLNAELQREVNQRTKIQNEKDTVVAESKAKSDFLSVVSHEIRTPLSGIISMTSFLSESPLTQEQQEYVSALQISGQHLLTILNDILDFAKMEHGKLKLNLGSFQLKNTIEGVVKIFQQGHEKPNLKISLDFFDQKSDKLSTLSSASQPVNCWASLSDQLCAIGDATRIRQILFNLLSNAVKFSPDDKGEIKVKVQKVPLGTNLLNSTHQSEKNGKFSLQNNQNLSSSSLNSLCSSTTELKTENFQEFVSKFQPPSDLKNNEVILGEKPRRGYSLLDDNSSSDTLTKLNAEQSQSGPNLKNSVSSYHQIFSYFHSLYDVIQKESSQNENGSKSKIHTLSSPFHNNNNSSENVQAPVDLKEAEPFELVFSVEDNGIGIPFEKQAELFSAFYQIQSATTRNYAGSGLGLAISRRLTSLMGGKIWFHSTPGVGSKFFVAIPTVMYHTMKKNDNNNNHIDKNNNNISVENMLSSGVNEVAKDVLEQNRLMLAKRKLDITFEKENNISSNHHSPELKDKNSNARAIERILIAEDNSINQQVISKLLEKLGYKRVKETKILESIQDVTYQNKSLVNEKIFYIVGDGSQAISAVEKFDFDIIFMDLQMPICGGLEASKIIKTMDWKKMQRVSPIIIALTASVLIEDKVACDAAGIEYHLAKPLKFDVLAQMMNTVEEKMNENSFKRKKFLKK